MRSILIGFVAAILAMLAVAGCGSSPAPPGVTSPPAPPGSASPDTASIGPTPTARPTRATMPASGPTAFPTAAPAAATATLPPFDRTARLFDYDAGAPLAIREVGVRNRGGVRVRDITYAAPGRRVRAYLVEPPGKGPFAGAVFLHWYAPAQPNGNRTEFLDEAAALARRGVVSVLPEGLFPWVESPKGDERDRELIARQVVELRRALDLLASREDVDPKRIGYVGHDYGAMYGALLASVDKRPRAYALMAPDATFGNWFLAFFVPPGDDAQRARYLEALAPLDPIYHVRRAAPGALLFQFGRYDQFIPEDTARQLSGAGSQPKRVEFYDAGHDLRDLEGKPTAAGGDRARWLGERLGLGGAQ